MFTYVVKNVKSSVSKASRVGARSARFSPVGSALGGLFTPLSYDTSHGELYATKG